MLMGFGLFQLKYHVVQLEQKLTFVQRKIGETKEATHVLKAELSVLTDPVRLQHLAEKHLSMTPVHAFQLISFSDLSGLPEIDNSMVQGQIPDVFFTKIAESQ